MSCNLFALFTVPAKLLIKHIPFHVFLSSTQTNQTLSDKLSRVIAPFCHKVSGVRAADRYCHHAYPVQTLDCFTEWSLYSQLLKLPPDKHFFFSLEDQKGRRTATLLTKTKCHSHAVWSSVKLYFGTVVLCAEY